MHCTGGDWQIGLEILRTHAWAANTFAGWYFLALHLPQRRSVLRLPSKICGESLDAIHAAAGFGDNPLCVLLSAVLEIGAANFGIKHLVQKMQIFNDVERARPEQPGEYVRLYWCLQNSFGVLQEYEKATRALIEGKIYAYAPTT